MIIRLLPTLLTLALALTGCTAERTSEVTAAKSVNTVPAPAPAFSSPTAAGRLPAVLTRSSSAGRPDAATTKSAPTKTTYKAGENPEFARQCGWPVLSPPPLPGSILPNQRIVAYYGNPLSRRMGILGEVPKDEMLRRLNAEAARWQAADPVTPVRPALHLVAVVAQGAPGKAGKYRMIVTDEIVNRVYQWAREANALLFIDIQTGHEDIRTLLPRFEWLLKNPDVHLGIDPEFNLIKSGRKPGTIIGTYDGADVNYVSGYLRDLVKKYQIPPKVLVVHRFTHNGVTSAKSIVLRPEVQIVMNMDGWGPPWLKRDSYEDYVVAEPVQYTGFKLFYHNDIKKGYPVMTPRDLLKLCPQPLYVQYQ
jgi:hypothetical protein